MTTPPRIASWALASLLGPADRELVIGDLWEEFHEHVLPSRGVRAARWWYRRQVVTSITPIVWRAWQTASTSRVTVASLVVLLAIVPCWTLIAMRSFVLSQVPLKTTAEPSALFLAALALCAASSLVGGAGCALLVLLSKGPSVAGGRQWPR